MDASCADGLISTITMRRGGAVTEWTFRLTLTGLDLSDEQLDALFEAGCDDAAFSL